MRSKWVLKKLQCEANADHRWEALVGPGKDPVCPTCGAAGVRPDPQLEAYAVIDDQIEGGPRFVHNIAHEPIFVETKSQYNALLKAHGLRNSVRHVGIPGTDKSPVTTSWDLPPTHDARPYCMLSPDEQKVRREEAAVRLGMTVEQLTFVSDTPGSKIEFKERPRSATWFEKTEG